MRVPGATHDWAICYMRVAAVLLSGGRNPECDIVKLLTWAGRGFGKLAGLMDRDELAVLDRDALAELIVRLVERVTELEARVGRPPKGPGNSSIPPSVG